ncbi:MAG TPA: hypothetical protein VFX70_10575 [Mycobacteriales bacterium]|nr:hypothetical protein [Mycobacteriales bacterium]
MEFLAPVARSVLAGFDQAAAVGLSELAGPDRSAAYQAGRLAHILARLADCDPGPVTPRRGDLAEVLAIVGRLGGIRRVLAEFDRADAAGLFDGPTAGRPVEATPAHWAGRLAECLRAVLGGPAALVDRDTR